MEKALTAIFDEYSSDIVVKKLAPAGNCQRNESFNVIGSINPKIRFYGGSESNDFRFLVEFARLTTEAAIFAKLQLRQI